MKTVLRRWLQRFPRLSHRLRAYKAYISSDREVRLFHRLCRADSHSIDVGAAYGGIAYWIRKHSSSVTLLEPNPEFVQLLSITFKGPDVTILPAAASSEAGETTLVIPDGHFGRATIDEENTRNVNAAFQQIDRHRVRLVRLDDLDIPSVGFIKIDVEGHEHAVLDGAQGILERDRPNLMVEIEERHHQGSFGLIYRRLEALGYRCASLDGRRFVEVTPKNFQRIQDPNGRYLYNFVFTADSSLFETLLTRGR